MANLIIKRRTAYTFSTISVSLVLFMIGAILYLVMNATKASNSLLENLKTVVILKDDTTDGELEELKKKITDTGLSSKITYTSKRQAADQFKEYIGDDFELKLGANPLPASLDVYLKSADDLKESVDKIKTAIKGDKIVDEVLYQQGLMDTLLKNISQFNVILLLFGLALLAVSIMMIDNSIRTAVLSKRFLIKTMLLVGATRNFIRRPFLGRALLQAFTSTIIASVMIAALIVGLKRTLPDVEIIYENIQALMLIPATMFVVGIVICFASTLSAVNKYMTLNDDELHTY